MEIVAGLKNLIVRFWIDYLMIIKCKNYLFNFFVYLWTIKGTTNEKIFTAIFYIFNLYI